MVIMEGGRPLLAADGGAVTNFSQVLEWGHRLAETDVGVSSSAGGTLWQAKGWKQLVEHMDPEKQPLAAIALENCRKYFGSMQESTRTSNLGSFDRWIFPVISNMAENDVIDQLVALQPMPGPTSQIVYMDIVTSQRKGYVPAGTPMWRAMGGAVDRYSDSDELVQDEPVGSTNGSGALSFNLEYTPARSGSVNITIGALVMVDNGNGVLVPSTGSATGTINYVSGAVSVSGAGNNTAATATYVFDSEGNDRIMGYDVKMTSAPVTARTYKLKAVWSEEADQNLSVLYNIKMESVLISAITSALQYQKHRAVLMDIRNRAAAGLVTFDATPATGVSYQTHKFELVDALVTASNFIFGATNTMRGNWVVVGLQAATVIETLPHFTPRGNLTDMQGITYLGDLGSMKVFVDPHYPNDEFVVGFKGDQFFRTGYVLAEFQKLYTTPDIVLPTFNHQRGFATSFAKVCVNPKAYCLGQITNAPTTFGGA